MDGCSDITANESYARVLSIVRAQLLALQIPGLRLDHLGDDALLIEDLGLDSLKFVDLTVALEDALGICEFPMQDWVDRQLEREAPLSLGALVIACLEQVA